MNKYNGETSVPSDRELLLWGWNTSQISQLRKLDPGLQKAVLQEYISKMMENQDSDDISF